MQVQITDLERALIIAWIKRSAANWQEVSSPEEKKVQEVLQTLSNKLYGPPRLFPIDTNLQP